MSRCLGMFTMVVAAVLVVSGCGEPAPKVGPVKSDHKPAGVTDKEPEKAKP
jgi:hypothetical protein